MVKHFYSFVVETETLFLEIESLEISDSEKSHLKSLAESHIHHSILDTILTELEPSDKKQFITHLNTLDHTGIWKFLHSKIENAEDKIKLAAHVIKKDLLKDIKEVK
jgi:hypothetical protein